MRRRDEDLSIAATALVALALLGTPIGSFAYDPRQDAKDFSKAVLIPKGEAISKDEAAPAEVPHHDPSPPETMYENDAAKMEADAMTAKGSSEGYNAMIASMASRATFPASEIEASTKVGREVISDPETYAGIPIGGTESSCTPLPPAVVSPGFYEQSCNTGYTETGGGPVTCNIPAKVVVQTVIRHECSWINAAFNGTDDCAVLDPYLGACKWVGSRPGKCLQWSGFPPNEWCSEPGEPIQQYDCPSPIPGATIVSSGKQLISAGPDPNACKPLDDDAACSISGPDVCVDDNPVTRIVDGLAVTLPCWAWTREYDCGGEMVMQSDCSELDSLGCTFDREQCLTPDDPCMTMERVYRCPIPPEPQPQDRYICTGDVYCIDGSCDTIDREPNTEFKDAVVALNAIAEAGREFDDINLTIFKGDALACTKLVFGLKNCCVPRGFPLIGGCSGEDSILKDRRDNGLCTYVGAWCSSSFLGICLEKKERHCCYGSRISRIIQEQGRPQLGLAWDDPEDETCAGLSVDQFALLDLSAMDFTEVYAEFVDAATLPAELDVLNEMQTRIEAYYASKGV
jgi:conjugal transfer mating pair stabilization protein TraN